MSIELLAVLLTAGFQSIVVLIGLVMLYRMSNKQLLMTQRRTSRVAGLSTRCAKCANRCGSANEHSQPLAPLSGAKCLILD